MSDKNIFKSPIELVRRKAEMDRAISTIELSKMKMENIQRKLDEKELAIQIEEQKLNLHKSLVRQLSNICRIDEGYLMGLDLKTIEFFTAFFDEADRWVEDISPAQILSNDLIVYVMIHEAGEKMKEALKLPPAPDKFNPVDEYLEKSIIGKAALIGFDKKYVQEIWQGYLKQHLKT